jgi:hypothetical protein
VAALGVPAPRTRHLAKVARTEKLHAHPAAKGAAHAARRSSAHASAKAHKPQPAQQVAAAPVDSDVALISAVIRHASRNNASAAGCDAGANCAAKATPQP